MKRLIALMLAMLCVVACFASCGEDESTYDYDIKSKVINNGGTTVSNGGTGNKNDSSTDFSNDFYIMDYFKKNGNTPVILYSVKGSGLSKDSEIDSIYVFENGKCRKFRNYYTADLRNEATKITLGSLAKMTDEEIITMFEDIYSKDLNWSLDKWRSFEDYAEALDNGSAKLYSAEYMDFEAYIETDDSGNRIENEVLVLPRAGIDDNASVIYYPGSSFKELNYQSATYSNGEFATEYFSWRELDKVCDVFRLSKDNIITGTVYDSIYYGYNSPKRDYKSNLIFFRHPDALVLDVKLDEMDSKNITYVDPTDEQLDSLASKHFNSYYSNFKALN